jgi:hypothetical protein
MAVRDLFNVKTSQTIVQAPAPVPGAAPVQDTKSQGVFLTPQSLVTFPGATAAGLLIWRVAIVLFPASTSVSSVWVPFVIALVLGAFIWWIGVSDPDAHMNTREKITAAGVALLNSLQIFASLLGLPH